MRRQSKISIIIALLLTTAILTIFMRPVGTNNDYKPKNAQAGNVKLQSTGSLCIHEQDASSLLSKFLQKYQKHIPYGLMVSNGGLNINNGLINITLKVVKPTRIIDVPVYLQVTLAPVVKDKMLYLRVRSARLGSLPLQPTFALRWFIDNINLPDGVAYKDDNIIITPFKTALLFLNNVSLADHALHFYFNLSI